MRYAVAFALLLSSCRSEAHEAPRPKQAAPAPKPQAPWSCGAVHEGAKVTRPELAKEALASGAPIVIGVVADTREALPATLGNLERFAGVFRKRHVALVVALGGLESTESGIASVLEALKGAGAPVFALPGDREPEAVFHAGVARAKREGLDVTDLANVRAVAGAGLALLSLPGYRWPHYLTAGDLGCRYDARDVAALAGLDRWLAGDPAHAKRPIVLIAYSPPRGNGPDALDWALGAANVGDPDLARLLPSLHAKVGLFAHVDEAGGRLSDGQSRIAAGVFSDRLYANVGSADSVPHDLLPRGIGRGQAMLVELADGRARAEVIGGGQASAGAAK